MTDARWTELQERYSFPAVFERCEAAKRDLDRALNALDDARATLAAVWSGVVLPAALAAKVMDTFDLLAAFDQEQAR